MDFVNKYVVRAEVASVHPEKMRTFCTHLKAGSIKIAHLQFSVKRHRALNHEARIEPFQTANGELYFASGRRLRGEGQIVVVADTEGDLSHCSIPSNHEQLESLEKFGEKYPNKQALMESSSNFFYIGERSNAFTTTHMNHVVTTCAGNISTPGKSQFSGVASDSKVIAIGFP